MPYSRWNAVDLVGGPNTQIYANAVGEVSFLNLAVANRNTTEVPIYIAITDNTDTPADKDWIEYFATVPQKGFLERTNLIVGALQRIIAKSPFSNISIQVWGEETTDSQLLLSGRKGSAYLAASTNTTIYTASTQQVERLMVNVANHNSSSTKIRLAITDGSDTPANKDWFEYDSFVSKFGTLERTKLNMSNGQKLVAWSEIANVSVNVVAKLVGT